MEVAGRPRQLIETVLGTPEAHRLLRRERQVRQRPMADVLDAVAARGAVGDPPSDEPLFLLSAGWRSGSTLVQRLVNSGASYFLWGEPYARADLIPRLTDSLRPITEAWPQGPDVVAGDRPPDIADRWTANLHPSFDALLDSHRALIRTLLAPPPDSGPGAGWGLKEVRLSADHAAYLRFLFPRAKFVFLVRNPLDAYASYKTWRSWYVRWPDEQVRTAWAYGRLWRELAGGFLAEATALGGVLIRYEDLVPDGSAIEALGRLLGTRIDEGVLARRISGHSGGPKPLSSLERGLIERRTAAVAARLGYGSDGLSPGPGG